MYISLHNHSHYSLFDGYQTIHEMVKRTKDLGMTSISLTDHGTLSGALDFYKECKKADVKPIIGCEFYLTPDVTIKDRNLTYHLIALAKNDIGYHNLIKLDTLAYQNVYYKPRIDWDMLRQYKEGIIVTSACMGGILKADLKNYKTFLDIFGKDFYLEIQSNTMPEQKEYNLDLVKLSQDTGIPLITTSDAHYATLEDAPYHKHWVGLKSSDYYPVQDFFIQSEADVRQRLAYLPKEVIDAAIANTQAISDACNVDIEVTGNHYPVFDVDDQLKAVKDACIKGWREKILPYVPKSDIPKYKERLNYEVDILDRCNYLNYLLIIQDILKWCKENNVMTGIGRGSCGGSLACYLMGITNINPMPYNLLFERFVNPERQSAADIDSDIEKTKRQAVIDYIKDKYKLVYNVRTFTFLDVKSAIQRACMCLNIPHSTTVTYSKYAEDFKVLPDDVKVLSEHLYGRLSGFGCHASAIMIFPDEPTNYCPIEKQGDNYVASYDYHDLENFNLLKLDILGLRNLSVIHDTLELVKERHGKDIDILSIPLDDANIFNMYAQGKTMGVFQCEKDGMRNLAKDLGVSCFEDVIALVALYRPGPLDSGMTRQFVNGKNGKVVKCLHPLIKDILAPTYQVIVYQEQVMQIVQVLAGFSLGEADKFRKIIGRKELTKDEDGKTPMDYAIEDFKDKAKENGIADDVLDALSNQIAACGRYIFNKSHASAYAMTSYITAWLKYYYPQEYMCSLLNSVIGDMDKLIPYLKECKELGIKVSKPDLRYSKPLFTIHDTGLYYALTAIKGIGSDVKPGKTFAEVIQNNNKRVVEALIKSGSIDYLGERGKLLGSLTDIQALCKREQQCLDKIKDYKAKLEIAKTDKDRNRITKSIQSWQDKLAEAQAKEVTAKAPDNFNEVAGEIEVLGWTDKQIPNLKVGTVTALFTKKDKNNHEMAWVTFKSEYGEIKCVCFASDWKHYKNYIHKGNPYKFVAKDGILKDILAI